MPENFYDQRILIVDDTPDNIDVLGNVLSGYKRSFALNGEKALEKAFGKNPPDIILLDIMMPGMDGYEVCRRLKADERTRDIPIIFVTALDEEADETRGLEYGAVDYITKPIRPPVVKARVRNHLELKMHRQHLEKLVKGRTRELELTRDVMIESMGTLAEYRDPETGGHIKRTQEYVRVLARHLQKHPKFRDYLDEKTIDMLYKSAPLHDIGKVGVPDAILLKPGELTPEEWVEMKKHTIYGFNTIKKAEEKLGFQSFLSCAEEVAYTHHEKYDGSGYPRGISGEEIPVSARLMALADVYDSLVSQRVYRETVFTHQEAVEAITRGDSRTSPRHFDPEVVRAFIETAEQFRQAALRFMDPKDSLP